MSSAAVRYSPAIEKALAEVCPSDDPIDQPDFDPIEYLNQQLPDESRLSALPTMLAEHQHRQATTETELLDAVKIQATTAHSAARDLHSAREAVVGLHQRVSGIKTKAEESERTVTEICRSIRQLDAAKRNLGESIKTLRNLQLLMIQLQNLRQGFQARNYAKMNDALRAAQARSKEFEDYKDIPKVNELQTKLHYLTQEIEGHVHSAFVLMMNKHRDQQNEEAPGAGDMGVTEEELSSACAVIDAIGDKSMVSLRKKIIQSELDAYTTMFRRGSEDARLERTEQRYAFIRRMLDTNEHLFSTVIPRHWCVSQELAVDFCLKTYEELQHQLRVEAGNMEVAVLVYVLQRTLDIEKELTNKLAWMDDQERKELASYKYYGMIVPCFHDHMGLYVNKEDETMDEAVGKGVDPDDWQDDNKNPRVNAWLSSADDLFVFIRESLKRVAKLGQPTTMGQMAVVYRKHLVSYSHLLSSMMPSAPTTPEQERRVCMVINTGEFCYDTSEKLAEEVRNKLKNEIETDQELADMVNFDDVLESYAGLKSSGILALVVGLDRKINQPMTEFSTGNFLNRLSGANAGDGLDGGESPHVLKITKSATDHVSNCALLLPPRDLKFFLEKFASTFAPRYCSVLYKLQRRLNDLAVNQLRVDLKLVEATFTQLPFAGSDHTNTVTAQEPRFEPRELTRYLRIIRGQFHHMAHSLKVLQCEVDLNLVEMYMQLVDKEQQSQTDFCMLVEVKGVKREDMRPWITALQRADVPETTSYDEARKPHLGSGRTGATTSGGGTSSSAHTFGSPTQSVPRATSALTIDGGGAGGIEDTENSVAKLKAKGGEFTAFFKRKAAEARERVKD